MHTEQENTRKIRNYYNLTAGGAYERWQGGTNAPSGFHFTYYDVPPDFSNTQVEDAFEAHQKSHERMLTKIADFINPSQGDIVIDAGCGEGGMFAVLENLGASVVGINIVHPHLLRAQNRVKSFQLKHSYPVEANYSKMPLGKNVANKILFLESLTHSPNQRQTLEDAVRVLAEDGEIIIIEPMLVQSRANLQDDVLKKTTQIDEGMALQVTSLPDLEAISQELNLEIIKIVDATENVFPSMQLAANSARAHEGEEASDDIHKHRLATIAYEELTAMGEMNYYFVKLRKKNIAISA